MSLHILLLSWNTASLLANCLRSLPAGADGIEYCVTVVDNASTDGSADLVERDFPEVHLIRNPSNLGFAAGNNIGLQAIVSQPSYILLLNSDTLVKPGALRALVQFMDTHPQAGAAGPRLLRPDGTPQPYSFGNDPTLAYLLARTLSRACFHRYLHDWGASDTREVDWASGACLIVRWEVIEQVGLLDEHFFMYFEDNDWCLRIRKAGWKIYYHPQVEIVHFGGQSLKQHARSRTMYVDSLSYFYTKHYSRLSQRILQLLLRLYRKIGA